MSAVVRPGPRPCRPAPGAGVSEPLPAGGPLMGRSDRVVSIPTAGRETVGMPPGPVPVEARTASASPPMGAEVRPEAGLAPGACLDRRG